MKAMTNIGMSASDRKTIEKNMMPEPNNLRRSLMKTGILAVGLATKAGKFGAKSFL